MLYALAYSDLGVLRLYDRTQISYHGHIESRMLQRIRITEEQGNVKGTTGVIPKHQICKKAQQDVGLFYAYNFSFGNATSSL